MTLDLGPIKERAERATKGPWLSSWTNPLPHLEGQLDDTIVYSTDATIQEKDRCVVGTLWYDGPNAACKQNDANFIAHARADIPALVAEVEALRAALGAEREREPEWIVNDIAELGVKIGDRCFFLYKGNSLEYEDTKHEDDGSPMLYRPVGKREFGETCHPIALKTMPERYTEPLVNPFEFGPKIIDGGWLPIPARRAPKIGGGE